MTAQEPTTASLSEVPSAPRGWDADVGIHDRADRSLHARCPYTRFIAGPDDRADQELGRNGGRLFDWLDDRESDGRSGKVYREMLANGAVISGRRSFELARRWQGDHHDGVPIFVLTHRVDDGTCRPPRAIVADVETCAREAAGDRAVMVQGAGAAQALLQLGHMDEMEIHLVQVLLGDGRRLFDHLGSVTSNSTSSDGSRIETSRTSATATRPTRPHEALFVATASDLDRSLDFYTALGYIEVGSVAGGDGVRLALLKFPDEPVATLELGRPSRGAWRW